MPWLHLMRPSNPFHIVRLKGMGQHFTNRDLRKPRPFSHFPKMVVAAFPYFCPCDQDCFQKTNKIIQDELERLALGTPMIS